MSYASEARGWYDCPMKGGIIMPFSTATENAILNEIFGKTDYVAPTTLYVGLSTTTPTKAGTNITEPVGGAYARAAVTNNVTNFPAASGSSKANGTVITFAEATGAWGNVTNWVVFDALSGGSMVCFGNITTPKTIDVGDTPSFNTGTLTITMA